MFAQGCEVPERVQLPLKLPHTPESRFMLMPAWNENLFGLKVVASLPENRVLSRPSLTATYLLFSLDDGHCVAALDGDELTTRRTAATSALAAQKLVRSDARKLFVLGSGRIASEIAYCFQQVAAFDEIRIWSRNSQHASKLAASWRNAGLSASVEEDRRKGVTWADVISSATPSTEPLIELRDVRPGTHVDLIGSFTPTMRESDAALITNARLFVDTTAACKESGDILEAPEITRAAAVELGALLSGAQPGRANDEEITVFKSVGHALQDFSAARLLYANGGHKA